MDQFEIITRARQDDAAAWEEDGITYRLEADRPLEEAVRIAESLA